MSSSVPGIFDKKINLGTVIEILVLVTGMAFGYRDVTNNQTHLKDQLNNHVKEVEKLKEEYVRKDLMLEHNALITEQLNGIKEDLQRIEKYLK